MATALTAQPVSSKADKKKIDKFEIDNAVRVLLEAEEIKQNGPLMAECHKLMGKKKKAIESISELREAASEMRNEKAKKSSEESEEEEEEEEE